MNGVTLDEQLLGDETDVIKDLILNVWRGGGGGGGI